MQVLTGSFRVDLTHFGAKHDEEKMLNGTLGFLHQELTEA